MSANKIQLTKNDESVLFTFTDSNHYLTGNGTIEVPINSLSLVIDKSNMVTFRKAASNDIFVSAPISDFGMSKAELEDWYAENMVGGTGGGIDPETLAELVSSAEYVSSSSTIDFKNVDGEVISTINAEPFITDGMVDNVQISGSNLVITFNVDAGKQPISIPLSSIFDPSNYYDKSATDTLLSGKADTSAVTVDEYSIYATRDNIISTAYTSTPITWVKITPKGNLGKSGSLQFSGVTGYLYIQNIDYVNGTYTVGSGSLDPSLVSGLSITFEDGAMIVEVDASNPITYASFSNTVIEYVKTVIPEKVVSDAVYDNLYPLIKKVDDSLTSITVNSASTTQYEISLKPRNNAKDILPNQIVSLGGYLSYSGTTLKAEAYVNTGTDTLTTVAPTINSSSRTDYFFANNVGQTAESNHIEIQILTGDTINLAFYGYDNTGRLTSRALVVSGGTVTSGYGWPSEATYSFSNGILTVDYAYTGTSANTPLTINRILATNQYASTASVSDIVGYVKALLKDKVEVTEYIENTLKPTIDGKQDTLKYYEEYQNENYSGAQITFNEDGDRVYIDAATGTYNYIDLFAEKTVNDAELGQDVVCKSEMYVDNEEAFLWWAKETNDDSTNKENGVWLSEEEFKLESKGSGETTALVITPTSVTINDDAVVTESMLDDYATVGDLEDTEEVLAQSINVLADKVDGIEDSEEVIAQSINVLSASLSGKQDTLVSGTNIKTINNQSLLGSGNITIQGGGGSSSISSVTQAQYDAAEQGGTLDSDTMYVISDAPAVNIANYYTKTEVDDLLLNVEIDVDTAITAGGTNAVEGGAIYTALQGKVNNGDAVVRIQTASTANGTVLQYSKDGFSYATATSIGSINGTKIATDTDFQLVTQSDYDEAQRVTAAALNDLNDRFGGMRIEKLTQVQYDALTVKDDNTLYIITNVVNNNA